MEINKEAFKSKDNKNHRLYKYVHSRLNDDGYKAFLKEELKWPIASSLVKFANNGYTMQDWLENIDEYLEDLVDYKLFKEDTKEMDEDIICTLPLLQMYENGEGIHEDDIFKKWKMLQTSFALESLRRQGIIRCTTHAKKFKFMPKSKHQASPYLEADETEDHIQVKFKSVTVSSVYNHPILKNIDPSKSDINYPVGTVWINELSDRCFVLDEIVHYSFDECPKAKWAILYASKWAKDKTELSKD